MTDTKRVILSVHRAFINDDIQISLWDLFAKIKHEIPHGMSAIARSLYDQTAVKFPEFPRTNTAIAVQFALYSEGAEASTIGQLSNNNMYSTTTTSAPKGSEFLSHEIAILVDGNYAVICGLGNRQAMLIDAIGKLADECGIPFPPGCMAFAPTPNKLSVETIKKVGVKSIQFDAANYLGSLEMPIDGPVGTIFGASSRAAHYERADMIATLSVRHKNFKGTILDFEAHTKSAFLEQAAIKTHEDENVGSYTIVLEDKTKWKSGDLVLSKKIDVAKDGTSYNMPEALSNMHAYLGELQHGGYLT